MNLDKKRGQFYLISAVIIILVIVSIVTISNYVYVKKQPQKVNDITDILELEGRYVIENAAYSGSSVQTNTETYLNLFSNYLKENINEDFNLVVIYGNAETGSVSGKVYNRQSLGNVNTNVFDVSFSSPGGSDISVQNTTVVINPTTAGQQKTVNVTISAGLTNFTQTLPLLQDNNFMFVMTTSQGFNQYVQTNLNNTRV